MPVDGDGHPRPLASTERLHNLWRNFQAPHGLRMLDVGSKLHNLLLPSWQLAAGPARPAPNASPAFRLGCRRRAQDGCRNELTCAFTASILSGSIGLSDVRVLSSSLRHWLPPP